MLEVAKYIGYIIKKEDNPELRKSKNGKKIIQTR